MAIPVRHAGAPYVNGETLSGTDLETDIANIYAEVSGNLGDANIASAANIQGTKLLDNSTPGAKLTADTITTSKMAAAAVSKAYTAASTAAAAMTASVAYVDIPNITQATLTPGSTSDMLIMSLTSLLVWSGLTPTWTFGFSVNGTDYTSAVYSLNGTTFTNVQISVHFAVLAPSTSAIIIKPRYKLSAGSGTADWATTIERRFTVFCLPIK